MNLDRETLKRLIAESINELSGVDPDKERPSAKDVAKGLKGLTGAGKMAAEGLGGLAEKLKSAFASVEGLNPTQKAVIADYFVTELLGTSSKEITSHMKKVQDAKEAAAERAAQTGDQGIQ